MQTISQTGAEAYANGNSDDYFTYYENYLKEMAAFYNTVSNAENKDGIIIVVTVKDGIVTCEVSPSAANPRNK